MTRISEAVLIGIRLWSKDRPQTTFPVCRRGKGAHWEKPHMSLSYHLSLRSLFRLLLSGRFIQALLYTLVSIRKCSCVKVELSYVFTINLFTIAENCTEK